MSVFPLPVTYYDCAITMIRPPQFQFVKCICFRTTEFGVELNRFMERFFVECRAIDVESLCIVAGEKVSCLVAFKYDILCCGKLKNRL